MTVEAPTYPSAPPDRIELPGGVHLARASMDRAPLVRKAIQASLDHLRPWMAWAAEPPTDASVGTFLAAAEELFDQRRDFGYSIVDTATGSVVGGCGLHGRLGTSGLEIGYWVHVDWIGWGLATATARALTEAAFAIDGVERVRIRCEEANARSARVPEKLGYRFHGVVEPGDGPCAGRPTQEWLVERADWMAALTTPSP